jgi:hypothetical protein
VTTALEAAFPWTLPAHASSRAAVPPALRGVWKRTLLAVPGRQDDTQSIVFWLQTAHWHGDLRLPAARPTFSRDAMHGLLSPEQVAWLSTQQGFAGFTEVRPPDHHAPLGLPEAQKSVAVNAPWVEWHRRFDLQVSRGARDLGVVVLSADGNTLEEYGVDSDYHETWQRLPGSAHLHCAWWRIRAGLGHSPGHTAPAPQQERELLLVAGDWFYHLRISPALPEALPALHPAHPAGGAPPAAGLTLSFGVWEEGNGSGVVQHSTAPWEEGRRIVRDTSWQLWRP